MPNNLLIYHYTIKLITSFQTNKMTQLSFSEKQDLLNLLSEEITRLNKELSKLPKNSNKISVLDRKQILPELIKRYRITWQKIDASF